MIACIRIQGLYLMLCDGLHLPMMVAAGIGQQPKDKACAPSVEACIMPGPPPDHVVTPSKDATSRPNSHERIQCGESSFRRALP